MKSAEDEAQAQRFDPVATKSKTPTCLEKNLLPVKFKSDILCCCYKADYRLVGFDPNRVWRRRQPPQLCDSCNQE